MLVLNEEDDNELSKLYEGEDIMEDYVRDAKDASISDDVVGLYDKELHEELLINTELYNAERKGKESGIREGKLDVARNMLKENISIEVIVKVTGLSRKEIDSLNSAKM